MTTKVKRGHEEDHCKQVSIEVLPNEVLGLIVSFLTFKEATATSILSRRWQYLWTSTRKLYLGPSSLKFFEKCRDGDAIHEEKCKFVSRVNRQISDMRHHKSSHNLEEFKLMFDLTYSHAQFIDDWLSYAVSRKVESLEVNLLDTSSQRALDEFTYTCYNFPYKNGNFPNNLSVLRKLSTHLVNITGEAVETFLRNCPMLEQVSVSQSQVLSSLEIIGTSPSFKCLEINYCRNLQSVVVRDSNVVCIKYSCAGGSIQRRRFELINVPLLNQLWIKGISPKRLNGVVSMFSSVFPQLEMFKIYVYCSLNWKESGNIVSGVEMRNLKEMVVNINGEAYDDVNSLLPIVNLISASPRLQRFVIEASHRDSEQMNLFDGVRRPTRGIPRNISNNPAYSHLKEIEFVGYRGVFSQFELIMHFVENNVAPILENIIVDQRRFKLRWHRPWDFIPRQKIEDEIFARHAKQHLKNYIPHNINVKFL